MSKYKTRMTDILLTMESKKALDKKFEVKICEDCGGEECVCETIEEALEVKYDKAKQGWFDKQGRRRYLGIAATNARMKKKLDLAIKTGDWTTFDIKKEEVQFNLEENTSKELPPHLKKLFGKDGKFINPKSQAVFDKMVKDAGGSDAFRKKHKMTTEMDETEVEECWSTHKQVGTKMKGGKSVPNCVPKSESRQLKDKDTEMMVVKHGKVIVIDKSDWDKYKLKGYKLAEGQDKDAVSNASGKNNSKSRIDDIEEKTVPKDKDTDQPKKFKQMYGETKKLLEFTTAQIKTLEREYAPLKGKTMSGDQLKKMNGILKKYDKSMLQKLANASIPMLTTGAKSELVINRGMKWTDFKESMKTPFEPKDKGDKEKTDKKPAGEDKDATIAKLEKENQMLKVKAEVDKMVEPNKDTGEVPLKVGLAQKILKDVKDGKRVKVKEKEGAKYKGVGTGQSKIEVDPKVDISPSAGGDK